MRWSFSFLWALLLSGFLFGCAKEPEVAPKKVNPRLAKSGKKLVKEPELAIAPDSSKSLDAKPKADNDAIRKDGDKSGGVEGGVVSEPASPAIPTQAERQQLIRQAQAGDANAQVDLGNIFFGGRGVPANKKAAEFWWRKAVAKRHPSAIQNLQMLYTKPGEGVSFFGASGKGERFVYLVDSSGSMRVGKRFIKEKNELIRSIQTLRPHMKFTVIFYDDVPHHNGPFKLYDASMDNIRNMTQWVTDRRLGHNNYMIPALQEAMKLKPDTIFLLSDGMADFRPERVCADVRKINLGKKVVINAVSLHDSKGRLLMKRIAEENNGKFQYVEPDRKSGEG